MTNNVIRFPGITKLDLDPDLMLQEAMGKLEGVLLLGYTKDGECYYASSYADGGEVMWLVERFKHHFHTVIDEI